MPLSRHENRKRRASLPLEGGRSIKGDLVLAAAALLLCFASFAPSASADSGNMKKYATAQVRLYTDIPAAEAQAVVEEIEFYHDFISAFFAGFGLSPKKSNPLRCYLYASEADFIQRRDGEFTLREEANAYFSPGNNRILAHYDNGSQRALAALRRQCSRPITARYLATTPPAWLEEGFACYFEGMAFDVHEKRITACGEFARLARMRALLERDQLMDWEKFFDERPLPGTFEAQTAGANHLNPRFSAQAWGVLFFYLEGTEEVRSAFARFIEGMNTGRLRTGFLAQDLKGRMEEFKVFFAEDHERALALWRSAIRQRDSDQYDECLKTVLRILEDSERNLPALRLAAEAAFSAGRFEASLSFWRLLRDLDPEGASYTTWICRCLTESGSRGGNASTIEEAVQAGKQAVKETSGKNPESQAALAAAYFAQGKLQDALKTIRKAVWLGGPSVDQYKEREDAYSAALREQYRGE